MMKKSHAIEQAMEKAAKHDDDLIYEILDKVVADAVPSDAKGEDLQDYVNLGASLQRRAGGQPIFYAVDEGNIYYFIGSEESIVKKIENLYRPGAKIGNASTKALARGVDYQWEEMEDGNWASGAGDYLLSTSGPHKNGKFGWMIQKLSDGTPIRGDFAVTIDEAKAKGLKAFKEVINTAEAETVQARTNEEILKAISEIIKKNDRDAAKKLFKEEQAKNPNFMSNIRYLVGYYDQDYQKKFYEIFDWL